MNCRCGQPKRLRWHLACEACWALVPAPLQAKVYRLYKQQPGSEAHVKAVRENYKAIADKRDPKALDLAAQIRATEDGKSWVQGTFGPRGIIASRVITPTTPEQTNNTDNL